MGKFNFNETPGKKVAEEIRDNHSEIDKRLAETNGYGLSNAEAEQVVRTGEPQQGRVAQPIPKANIQMQEVAQPATPVPAQVNEVSMPVSVLKGGPLVYNEETKGISVKLPYYLYDALDVLKKRSQRTGNRNDKMGIGDLVVLAVKEFVEKHEVVNA